jgi:hypothetical protein
MAAFWVIKARIRGLFMRSRLDQRLDKELLRPGRTVAEAAAEIRGIGAQLDLTFPIGRDLDPRMRLGLYHTSGQWSVRRAAEVGVDESVDLIIS